MITTDVNLSSTILVGLLNGSVVFLSDLMRRLSHHGACPLVDFMIVSSYEDSTGEGGAIRIVQDIRSTIAGKQALLIDDIVDTGATMSMVADHLLDKGASRVITCALLDKPSRRKVDFSPDYTGFTIDNHFVVGYGMDAGARHRCLPYIAILEQFDQLGQ